MIYWYETQERAFAPNIADGWPKFITAPHTKNGRLVRRDGDPADLLKAAHAALGYVVSRGDLRANTEASQLQSLLRAAIAKAEGREP